jgi:hypothetical protein
MSVGGQKKVQWVDTMPGKRRASHVIDINFRSIGGPKEKLKAIDRREILVQALSITPSPTNANLIANTYK